VVPPLIGKSWWDSWKNVTWGGKKLLSQHQHAKKPGITGKNASCFVTCYISIMVCMHQKRKCLWRGRLMSCTVSVVTCIVLFAVFCSLKPLWWLTHEKPWSSNLMKFVMAHVSWSYSLLVCRVIAYIESGGLGKHQARNYFGEANMRKRCRVSMNQTMRSIKGEQSWWITASDEYLILHF
jgi:hypothetical protein